MLLLHGNQRFFASTRGQIIILLRHTNRTVDELAQALDLTDNAVRAHLATLERDGFVRQQGTRRRSGKPAYVYNLTPEAELLFPKAYGSILHELLELLSEHMTSQEVEVLMCAIGRRIAAKWSVPSGDLHVRLEVAIAAFNELGGMAELELQDGSHCIRGHSCPLAAVVPGHPEACHLVETLLKEVVAVTVQGQCVHSEKLQCRFILIDSRLGPLVLVDAPS